MAKSRRERTAAARPALLQLLTKLSYRRGHVVLSSGQTSDFFIDCKPSVLTAEGHALCGELMLDALRHNPNIGGVAGVALGGCSLASAVATMSHLRGRPLDAVYVRKAAKEHGSRRMVEGNILPNMKVALLEDVVTTGGSTIRAIETLRAVGVEVLKVVVLVDRLEGGVENIRQQTGIDVLSIYTRHDFVESGFGLEMPLSEDTIADG